MVMYENVYGFSQSCDFRSATLFANEAPDPALHYLGVDFALNALSVAAEGAENPVTAKQKQEADKLERYRKQIGVPPPVPATEEENDHKGPSKRPMYHHKKKKCMRTNRKIQVGNVAEEKSLQVVHEYSVEEIRIVEDDKGNEWDPYSWEDQAPISSGTEKLRETEVEVEVEVDTKKDADVEGPSSVSAVEESEEENFLRSPICCVMGHVDAGKTKLLDCIRGTNVQKGEAGGITQQIGATYLPAENIQERIKELKAADDKHMKVPGLLLIDTPGHEPFTKLRSRGSGLCDIAVLVVDIMDGLKPQTIESLNLLKSRNTEFIVALNKVDRLNGWKPCPNAPIIKPMKQQSQDVKNEFNMRVVQIVTQFKEQGINTKLNVDENKRMRETYSIVPISAKSGEGIPDLLSLMVYWTQKSMTEKLTYSNEVQCTVLEVKYVEGLGTTIDVILVNGVLRRGDQIVVCGNHGTPIVTRIQSLLTPEPNTVQTGQTGRNRLVNMVWLRFFSVKI
ncbi:eukaryotic translation initiation factor 5B-like [Rosa rugosa]|uniref:eukaryotic translation initiation factor 5B-like n=1 Tax=Rosa rugosa TaxID=74645 RepID=UPI002B40EEF7|nr:eukaryotic translation initiation factor 5B-like [Rosa rugosa]